MIKKLRVCGIDYEVQLSNKLISDHNAAGMCYPDSSLIEVSTHCSPQAARMTLLHETLEAICSHLNIEIEHHYIELLEAGLFQVIRDNPEFVKYITSKEK